jgi:hypothetical protein
VSDELVSFRIVSKNADRQRFRAESAKIVNRIGAASGNDLSLSMVQDKYRSLP